MEDNVRASGSSQSGLVANREAESSGSRRSNGRNPKNSSRRQNRNRGGIGQYQGGYHQGNHDMSMVHGYRFDRSSGPFLSEDGNESWNSHAVSFNGNEPAVMGYNQNMNQRQQDVRYRKRSDTGSSTRRRDKERARDDRDDERRSKNGSDVESRKRHSRHRDRSRDRGRNRDDSRWKSEPRNSRETSRKTTEDRYRGEAKSPTTERYGRRTSPDFEVSYYRPAYIAERKEERRSVSPSARHNRWPRAVEQEGRAGRSNVDVESPSRLDETDHTWQERSQTPTNKIQNAAPSDAMQAAMELALGLTPGSLKTSVDSSLGNDGGDDYDDDGFSVQDAERCPLPKLQRARPDEVYEQIAQVGEGTYGQVFKARADKTGIIVALKKIRMESEKDGFPITAMREIKLLQGLRHENVVRLHEMMLSKNSIYMVFEYLEHDLNGILSQPLIQFEPAHLKSLAFQLLSGLAYLHRQGILHRDLKGSNLLLNSEGTLKLADFGLARRFTKMSKETLDYTNRVVTLWYRPPELLFGETCYNDAIDVWGAGCIFIELFTRKPIFQGSDEIHQVQLLLEQLGPIEQEEWPDVETLPWYNLVRSPPGEEMMDEKGAREDEGKQQRQTKPTIRGRLEEQFASRMPSDALDVASALLCYNPARRISASSALRMHYFARNLPRPEKPKRVLERVIGEWHELESRQARRGLLPPPVAASSQANNPQQQPPPLSRIGSVA